MAHIHIFASPPGFLPNLSFPYLPTCTDSLSQHDQLIPEPTNLTNTQTQIEFLNLDTPSEPVGNSAAKRTNLNPVHATHSMNNIHNPKQLHSVAKRPIPPTIVPSYVSHALRDPK